MKRYRLVCSSSGFDVFIQGLMWLILLLVTFGVALPFFAFSLLKFAINNTEIHDVTQVSDQ